MGKGSTLCLSVDSLVISQGSRWNRGGEDDSSDKHTGRCCSDIVPTHPGCSCACVLRNTVVPEGASDQIGKDVYLQD